MLSFLAQSVAPVLTSAAGGIAGTGFDWIHAALGLAITVLVTFGPLIHRMLLAKNAKAALAFGMMQEAADKSLHGEGWARVATELASEHSAEMMDLVASAIPNKLLPPAAPPPAQPGQRIG